MVKWKGFEELTVEPYAHVEHLVVSEELRAAQKPLIHSELVDLFDKLIEFKAAPSWTWAQMSF